MSTDDERYYQLTFRKRMTSSGVAFEYVHGDKTVLRHLEPTGHGGIVKISEERWKFFCTLADIHNVSVKVVSYGV